MKKFINILSALIIASTFFTSCGGGSNELSSNLTNNLANLNGVWSYKNSREDELWMINICYNNDSKTGTYITKIIKEAWGGNKADTTIVSEGDFILEEGYDVYGDKALVAKNTSSGGSQTFAIVRLDSDDWNLEPLELQNEMVGGGMNKVSNECK